MNVYETFFILDASLADEAIEETTTKIKDTITTGGGEVLKAEPWGRRRLAFDIHKQSRGYYVLFLYKAPATVNRTLEEFAKVSDQVTKFMIVKLEKNQREHVLKALQAAQAAAAAPAAAPAAPVAPAEPAAALAEGA